MKRLLLIILPLFIFSCSVTYNTEEVKKNYNKRIYYEAESKKIDIYFSSGECLRKYEVVSIYKPRHEAFDNFIFFSRKRFVKNGKFVYKGIQKAIKDKCNAIIVVDEYVIQTIKYIN